MHAVFFRFTQTWQEYLELISRNPIPVAAMSVTFFIIFIAMVFAHNSDKRLFKQVYNISEYR